MEALGRCVQASVEGSGSIYTCFWVYLQRPAGDESIHTAAPPTGATRVLVHFGIWRWFWIYVDGHKLFSFMQLEKYLTTM